MNAIRWIAVLCALAGCQVEAVGTSAAELGEVEPEEPAPVLLDRVASLRPASRATLEQSRLPVLLPADEDLLATAVVTTGSHFVAWGADGDGVHVSLHGTDHQWAVGEGPPEPPVDSVRGHRAYVSVNEGIHVATWTEAGVMWALDVECDAVLEDDRCADDAYVRSLAESLERVGGGAR